MMGAPLRFLIRVLHGMEPRELQLRWELSADRLRAEIDETEKRVRSGN